jgi:hypothetical protein
MKTSHLISSLVALSVAAAPGLAFAQSQNQGGAAGAQMANPQDITCAQLTALDTAVVPGILYFLSGYSAGQRGQVGGNAASTTGDVSSATPDGTAGDATQSAEANQTGSATNQQPAQDQDMDTAQAGSATGDDAADPTTTGSTGQGNVQVGRVAGYFEIPLQEIYIACQQNPGSQVSQLLDEESRRQGASGATSNSTSN